MPTNQYRRSFPNGKTVASGLPNVPLKMHRTDEFKKWLKELPDTGAKVRIEPRLDRLARGNPGDKKPVGKSVWELRINYGPGYRIYFVRRGGALVILLCGGDKGSQDRDIARAKAIARTM